MTLKDEAEIVALMRATRKKARGYADFFGWAIDRDIEEWGVVSALSESLEKDNRSFFWSIRRRGRPNDPPDCEALTSTASRVAIEVTELVDGEAIRAYKKGRVYDWAEWSKERFLSALADLVTRKDDRFPELKDPPYDGGYIVVVHSSESMLSDATVAEMLAGHRFNKPRYVQRAFLILAYDPVSERCPYFELAFDS